MNERIKELVEQAETKELGYYFFDKEKFAELIIKKCGEIADEHSDHAILSNPINKYFGVE